MDVNDEMMHFEYIDRPYGLALYLVTDDGESHRVGGFKDEGEAEEHVLDKLCEA